MSLHPASLEPGAKVTVLYVKLYKGTTFGIGSGAQEWEHRDVRSMRCTFQNHTQSGACAFKSGGGHTMVYDYTDEGSAWIRGWPARDGAEVNAMLAADALRTTHAPLAISGWIKFDNGLAVPMWA